LEDIDMSNPAQKPHEKCQLCLGTYVNYVVEQHTFGAAM
jgi:hypothetical protein